MRPLVTVGIPTYNRPEGLRKTLRCITQQTYQNLQIIIADNCSENEEVKIVGEEFVKNDPRVCYFRHDENKGVNFNFKFVLNKAEGSYFMWAADDDDWNSEYISELMSIIGEHSAAFSNYAVKYEKSGLTDHIKIIASATGNNKYEQARNYLQERIPSLFYGIYKTSDIKWFVSVDPLFDWFDCYFVLKIILLYNGYAFSNKELYTAGVHGNNYEYKPLNPSSKRIFTYSPYFIHSSKVIFKSEISFVQKLKLMAYLIEVNFRAFLMTEKTRKNYKFYAFLHRIYCRMVPSLHFYEH